MGDVIGTVTFTVNGGKTVRTVEWSPCRTCGAVPASVQQVDAEGHIVWALPCGHHRIIRPLDERCALCESGTHSDKAEALLRIAS